MKKVYNISFVFLFSLCAILSCTEKYNFNETASTDNTQTSLIVQEAKEFFANNYAAYAYARSGGKTDANKYLNPGDFTPMWEKSVVSQNAGYVNVDVPIISQNRFRVLRSEIRNGQAQAYKVVVTQRLVISKDIESGKQLSYLMNFIPDRKYYAQNKGNVGNHVTSLGKEDFSGLIVYALCPGNYPFKIESCKDKNSTAVTMPFMRCRPVMKMICGIIIGVKIMGLMNGGMIHGMIYLAKVGMIVVMNLDLNQNQRMEMTLICLFCLKSIIILAIPI